ncbi:MAG: class II aldolase [Clostridiales bacterium]|nr:class II aldolase [Clostridiales bacterium]
MSLVKMSSLLEYAESRKCAVGAFSVGNMEMVIGAVKAAEETETPIILQIAEKRMKQSPLELMAPMMVSAAENASVPIAVHLDHGLTMECIEKVLGYGFTSVMLDGSLLPFEENIELTKKVKRAADKYGATVEAELGVVGGNEGDSAKHEILCTDPDKALEFCERTDIDCLAVAIGNAHGNYPVLPELRFDVLEEIYNKLETPLVLHGGTGITAEMFKKAISLGIRKINIATASFDAAANAAKEYSSSVDKPDYFTLSPKMAEAVYENVKRHINIFSSKH